MALLYESTFSIILIQEEVPKQSLLFKVRFDVSGRLIGGSFGPKPSRRETSTLAVVR